MLSIQTFMFLNLLRVNQTKWSNTLKQFVGKLPTNCLSVFDHFVGLALKGLSSLRVVFYSGFKLIYGVDGELLALLRDYLDDREQRVPLNGQCRSGKK